MLRLTDVDVDELLDELEVLVEAFCDDDWFNYCIHYWVFYFGIYNHCNSSWLLRFMEMLWVNSERYQFMTMRIKGELCQWLIEYWCIFKVICVCDVDLVV